MNSPASRRDSRSGEDEGSPGRRTRIGPRAGKHEDALARPDGRPSDTCSRRLDRRKSSQNAREQRTSFAHRFPPTLCSLPVGSWRGFISQSDGRAQGGFPSRNSGPDTRFQGAALRRYLGIRPSISGRTRATRAPRFSVRASSPAHARSPRARRHGRSRDLGPSRRDSAGSEWERRRSRRCRCPGPRPRA